MSESPDTQAEAVLPHSRACRFVKHDHGSDCHTNCPTCGGQTAYSPSAEPEGEACGNCLHTPRTRPIACHCACHGARR